MTQERFYIGAPAVDYLTLTTFDREKFEQARALAVSVSEGDTAAGKQLQYVGERGTGYFAGQGSQKGKDHFLVSTSAAYAHDMLRLTHEAAERVQGIRCSRMDLQVTVPLPGDLFSLSAVGRRLRAGELGPFRRRGAASRIDIIDNNEGLDTVYVGARSSPRFVRIYVKKIAGKSYLRFEVEFKGDLAAQSWKAARGRGVSVLGPLLRAELDALPAAFVARLGEVYAACGDELGDRLRIVHGEATWERQLNWVLNQVWPTLEELMTTPAEETLTTMMRELLQGHYYTRRGM